MPGMHAVLMRVNQLSCLLNYHRHMLGCSSGLCQLGRLLGKPGADSIERQGLEICLREFAAWARPLPVAGKAPAVHVPDLQPREPTPESRLVTCCITPMLSICLHFSTAPGTCVPTQGMSALCD